MFSMFRMISRVIGSLVLASTLGAQVAQMPAAAPAPGVMQQPGESLTVSLLTMGNGEQVWQMFGHTAIWIRDARSGRDTVFNWGVFDMSQPNFIAHFLKGLNVYQMGGSTIAQLLYEYRYWNRSVVSQELDLTAAQKDSLLAIIRVNALPENVQYRYDYFVDNCSTRPRDILDRVLGGQLRVGADSVTARSYRWHALRLMQRNRPLALGVNIGLGEPSDLPVTRWQEMFLPKQLHDWVATRQVRDSVGGLHPLVKGERVLLEAHDRPPELAAPPSFAWLWIAGLVLAALVAWLGVKAMAGSRGARIGAATLLGVWATTCGLLGVILTLLWTVTDHRFAHANENLLLFNPLWLLLAVMLPLFVVRGTGGVVVRSLVMLVAGLSVIALLTHVAGVARQDNLAVIGLTLPVVVAIAYLVRRGVSRRVEH